METPKRMELVNAIVKKVRPLLQDHQTKNVLDYGSGSGLVSLELADLVNSVLLVDTSEQALQEAADKIASRGISNCTVLRSDFTQAFPDLKADVVLLSLVLLHIPNTQDILQKLFHVLPDGGQLIIVDFDKNERVSHPKIHNGFVHDELKHLLTDVGFTTLSMETFYHGEQIFANQDASMFVSVHTK